jgi:PAS domain S-box-containing protein
MINLTVLQAIFASMEQGIVFIDDQNRIAYCNSAAEKIRNFRFERVAGESILDCHPDKSHAKVLQIIEDLRSGKVKGHHRMNLQLVEGKFYDNTYSAVWGPENDYLGVIVVTQEVTERRKIEDDLRQANEELKRLDQMKDDFLSNVSHELKTPMVSVMGYTGMVLREKAGSLTGQQKKYLEISSKNLLKLEKNIDNLLDLAEFGILKETWAFEPVNLCEVIEFSCSTVEPLATEHDIRIETHLPSAPVMISGVQDKLNQLFDNLLTNAIKYNRQGGKIVVELSLSPDSAFVRVSDTGIGISHQSLEEVFIRHYQEKNRSLGDIKGLGIGLSLVHEITQLHKGKIHLESVVGKGTTVTVMLPKNP